MNGTARRNWRFYFSVEHSNQQPNDLNSDPRAPSAKACRKQQHHRANHIGWKLIADTRCMRANQVALYYANLIGSDSDA